MFTFKEILNRIKKRFKNPDNHIEGSFSMDNAQAVAQTIAEFHSTAIEPIVDNVSLDTATSKYLDRKAIDFNMTRNPPIASRGIVIISGASGLYIPNGVKVQSAELTFTLMSDCTIGDSGSCEVIIQCDTAGTVGNIQANTIEGFTLSSNIYGCTVTNPEALTGGIDIEDDDAFRQRIFEKIQRPITSGNANHYIYWAKQISGISDARCISCWNGAGTVKVVVFSNGSVTSEDRVNAVAEHIERERPIGATVTVVPALSHNTAIDCQLTLWDDMSPTAIADKIKSVIMAHVASSQDKTRLSYHKISDLLYSITGIADVLSYAIDGKTESVQVTCDEFINISEVTVNAS